jgi:hypothetical protein
VTPVALRPRTLALTVFAAALLGGAARGLMTGPTAPAHLPATVATTEPGPRVAAANGLPSGFAHSPAGALAAATTYVRQGQRLFDMAPDQRSTALQNLAARGAAAEFVADETAQLTELDGVATRGQGHLTWDVIVLATRTDAYTPPRARVSVWRVGILSIDGLTAPLAEWTTVVYDLVWERADWRVWAETQSPGPTPIPHPAETASTPDSLRTSLAGFARYPGTDPL